MQKIFNELIKKYSSETIIKRLDPYLTPNRKKRIETILASRLNSIQLAIECPSDINNALAAVRSSEAMGISTVHIIAPEGEAVHARSITQGAVHWVNIIYYENLKKFLNAMHSQNILLAGGTIDATKSLSDVPINKPICIMIGNEQRGLSDEAQAACHIKFQIPMYGMSESLNLSVSAAISLYDTTTRKRKSLKQLSDLTPQERLDQQAIYYLNSVKPRLVKGLFK